MEKWVFHSYLSCCFRSGCLFLQSFLLKDLQRLPSFRWSRYYYFERYRSFLWKERNPCSNDKFATNSKFHRRHTSNGNWSRGRESVTIYFKIFYILYSSIYYHTIISNISNISIENFFKFHKYL